MERIYQAILNFHTYIIDSACPYFITLIETDTYFSKKIVLPIMRRFHGINLVTIAMPEVKQIIIILLNSREEWLLA